MEQNILNQEKEKLKEVLKSFEEAIEDIKFRIEFLPSTYRDNLDLFAAFAVLYTRKLEVMERTALKPYFGRIDFKPEGDEPEEICYIGKVGVFDSEDRIVTVDWRAPISALYYDSNIGKASYEAPAGQIFGEMLTKRQIDIEKGVLLGYQDVDTVSNDEILKPYLGVNAENRLKNIVASIQREQNTIIREKFGKNLIVQGVAGSGKTTVALHRIAYLVYNHIDTIRPEQYLVIGPNSFFISYISGVLPDLDVSNVSQMTYEELAKAFVEEKFEIASGEKNLTDAIAGEKTENLRHKTSMKYKEELDVFLSEFEETVVPDDDFEAEGVTLLRAKEIYQVYTSLDKQVYKNVQTRAEKAALLLSGLLENRCGKGFLKELKRHFSKSNVKATTLYNQFLGEARKKPYEFEDLAGLMYVKCKLQGEGEMRAYRQCIMDEAQDLGEFNYYVLRLIMPESAFSIFGDLAQSIYEHRGIGSWESVAEEAFGGKCEIVKLVKSYRTTIEIMETANKINRHLGLSEAEAVIRHGKAPTYQSFFNDQEQVAFIKERLLELKESEYQSIAVICKSVKEAEVLGRKLDKAGIEAEAILAGDHTYNGGLCIMPVHLAKGLEFDAVIIADASQIAYNSKRQLDMKLLYVALTRALHELHILFEEELNYALRQ